MKHGIDEVKFNMFIDKDNNIFHVDESKRRWIVGYYYDNPKPEHRIYDYPRRGNLILVLLTDSAGEYEDYRGIRLHNNGGWSESLDPIDTFDQIKAILGKSVLNQQWHEDDTGKRRVYFYYFDPIKELPDDV